MGIAADSSGHVYVADAGNYSIQKFSSDGTFITKWGSEGGGDGEFTYQLSDCSKKVAVDPTSGNVYVCDYSISGGFSLQNFDSSGTFIRKWEFVPGFFTFLASGISGIAVDPSGNVYLAFNLKVQKFSSSYSFPSWGSRGDGDGQFKSIDGFAVDRSGSVYLADGVNKRIQKFSSNGTFITKWGSKGDGDGQFNSIYGIAVDSFGNVYVGDAANYKFLYGYRNYRIQVFSPSTSC
jgi:hypothetical protein